MSSENDFLTEEEFLQFFESEDSWKLASRYHEIKSKLPSQQSKDLLRKRSVKIILKKAKEVMGSLTQPLSLKSIPLSEFSDLEYEDVDLDTTLEESLPDLKELWVEIKEKKVQPVVICVDTSLSMTGEKLLLTAVALAVVLLQFKDAPIAVIAFENKALTLKQLNERLPIELILEKFLEVPAKGYTHLENGLKEALKQEKKNGHQPGSRNPVTLLLTDGKYTAGKDPDFLAPQFHQLFVLKMGGERASLSVCQSLARLGKGQLREVSDLTNLPNVMYSVVKDLLRGRSIRG